ncbi:MAG: ATP-dependent zinc metalloprotease FtsH [Lachnospiraceae bacterium]|nr:ATP-dependent zinc metalloprotease FtsH [Lachnospiraceae bacterium]
MDGNRQKQKNNGGKGNPGGIPQALFGILIAIVTSLFIYSVLFTGGAGRLMSNNQLEISYSEFMEKVEDGSIYRVRIAAEDIYAYEKGVPFDANLQGVDTEEELDNFMKNYTASQDKIYHIVKVQDDNLVDKLLAKGDIEIIGAKASVVMDLIISFAPFLILWLLIGMFARRMSAGMGGAMGGIFGVGQSKAKRYMQKETGVTFKDVAGEDEAKESLQEIVDFLHNPKKYTYVGAKLPKGALLVGPPGTGKTLLAKAVAGEAKVPFFSMTGSDFVEMFAGVGASRVRDLFKQAKQAAPCIVFIDEIDAIGRSRDTRAGSGADSEREQTLNQLLSEMDGFEINNGIMVMAATNRPEILDQALLRPGRFDRRIVVEKPDLKGRVNILKVHAKDVKLDDTVDFEEIALSTSGAVGADLANMINEAAITAAKAKREKVSQQDLKDAVEVVLVGKEKKDRILSKEERKIVSYHEVGHALVTALQKHTEPVQKITIVPRTMGALGYVLQTPEEEKYLNTKKELEERLVVYLSGRAAEDVVFDTITTGAANDIEEATKLARAMVTQYGMSEKFGLMGLATTRSMYLENGVDMNCGDETATAVDEEVKEMLKKAFEKAKKLLRENREALDKIAEYLIEKETITGKEFMKLFTEITGIEEEKTERIVSKEEDVNV